MPVPLVVVDAVVSGDFVVFTFRPSRPCLLKPLADVRVQTEPLPGVHVYGPVSVGLKAVVPERLALPADPAHGPLVAAYALPPFEFLWPQTGVRTESLGALLAAFRKHQKQQSD